MKYQGYMPNDFINGKGVCVSLWTQGCPHKCVGCHNSETWDFNGGYEVPNDLKDQLINAISANGITRNFSILGGEPLCSENRKFVADIVTAIRAAYPQIQIFLWTGYELNDLYPLDNDLQIIMDCVNYIIDGPYIEELRDISLPLRGSSNQNVNLIFH